MARFTTSFGRPNFTTQGTQYANIYIQYEQPIFDIVPNSAVVDEGREVNFTVSQVNANLLLNRDYFWDIEFRDDVENIPKYANVSFHEVRFGNTVGNANVYLVDITGNVIETIYNESGNTGTRAWQYKNIQYEIPVNPYRIVWHYVGPTAPSPDGEGDYALDSITIDSLLYQFEGNFGGTNWITTYGNPNLTEDYDNPEDVISGRTRTLIPVPQPLSTSLGTFFLTAETAGSKTGPETAHNGEYYILADTTGSSDANVSSQIPVNFWLFSPLRPGKFGYDDFVSNRDKVSIVDNRGTLNVRVINDFTVEGEEQFRVVLRSRRSSSAVAYSSYVTINDTSTGLTQGVYSLSDQLFQSAGWREWAVPQGVTKISVVAIGAGADGAAGTSTASSGAGRGGGGGGLNYRNDIQVTPGEILRVRVGTGGGGSRDGASIVRRGPDDPAYLTNQYNPNTDLVYASGGNSSTGGTRFGEGSGSSGGAGGTGQLYAGGGGGGAGGYGTPGGRGGTRSYVSYPVGSTSIDSTKSSGAAGSAGTIGGASGGGGGGGSAGVANAGGGGGGGGSLYGTIDYETLNNYTAAAGGTYGTSEYEGHGYGEGDDGETAHFLGGNGADGGWPGGGGGGSRNGTTYTGGRGASGAVRIVWITDAQFPNKFVYKTEVSHDGSASGSLVPQYLYTKPINSTWWAADLRHPDTSFNFKLQTIELDTFTSNVVALARVEKLGTYDNRYAVVRMTDQGNLLPGLMTTARISHNSENNLHSTLMNDYSMIVAAEIYDPPNTNSTNLEISCITPENDYRWSRKIEIADKVTHPLLTNTDDYLYLYYKDVDPSLSGNAYLCRIDPLDGNIIWRLRDASWNSASNSYVTKQTYLDSDSKGNAIVGLINGIRSYLPDGEKTLQINSVTVAAEKQILFNTTYSLQTVSVVPFSDNLRVSWTHYPDPTKVDSSDLYTHAQSWRQSAQVKPDGTGVSKSGRSYSLPSSAASWSGNDPVAIENYSKWDREGVWRSSSSLVSAETLATQDQNGVTFGVNLRSYSSIKAEPPTGIAFPSSERRYQPQYIGSRGDLVTLVQPLPRDMIADVFSYSLYSVGYLNTSTTSYPYASMSAIYKLPIKQPIGEFTDSLNAANSISVATVGSTLFPSFDAVNVSKNNNPSQAEFVETIVSDITVESEEWTPNVNGFYPIEDTILKPLEAQWAASTGLPNVISVASVSKGDYTYVAMISHNKGTLLDSNLKYSAGPKYTNATVSVHKLDNKGDLIKSINLGDGANSACKIGGIDVDPTGNVYLAYSYIDTETWITNPHGFNHTVARGGGIVSTKSDSTSNYALWIAFSPDGTKMVEISYSKKIYIWDLSTPWDISSATVDENKLLNYGPGISGYGTITPSGLSVSPDGDKIFILSNYNQRPVIQIDLSTPWDLSTATVSTIKDLLPEFGSAAYYGLQFHPDGTKMYISQSSTNAALNKYLQFTLSTPWDLSTATLEKSVSAGSYTSRRALALSGTGEKLYTNDTANEMFIEYTLSTPWDIASISGPTEYQHLLNWDVSSGGQNITVSPDNKHVYGTSFRAIVQADHNVRKVDHVFMSIDGDLSTINWQNRIIGDTEFGSWFIKYWNNEQLVASAGAELFRLNPFTGMPDAYTTSINNLTPARSGNYAYDAADNDGRRILRYSLHQNDATKASRWALVEYHDMELGADINVITTGLADRSKFTTL